jgi:Xaa-Pro aminopeptidase
MTTTLHGSRLERIRARMSDLGVDALLLSHGADLPWLTGYRAMPLERLTVLVLPREGEPVLIVPALEAPRVPDAADGFSVRPWGESEDPVGIAAGLLKMATVSGSGSPGTIGISDRSWAVTLLSFQEQFPGTRWLPASRVTAPLRAVKDPAEVAALRAAARAADQVADALHAGEIPLIGQSEASVSEEISRRLLHAGHTAVNFAIVASGPNAASPHHEPGERRIGVGETVVCDFGGALSLDGDVGYCSDITRTVVTGPVPDDVADAYAVLTAGHSAGLAAVAPGVSAASVDGATREAITQAGWGQYFIHRTGHGIGIEEHEDPYLVAGNEEPLVPGNAFSIEPGIYVPGRFGMRLEDIVVLTPSGPEVLNAADRSLRIVEA